MTSQELTQIEFYFPSMEKKVKSKQELVGLIMHEMREKGSLSYSGFLNEKSLRDALMQNIGNGDFSKYRDHLSAQQEQIKTTIEETCVKCNDVLPIPTKNYIFVFPYLPDKKQKVFDGVMGFAPYSCVFLLFIAQDKWNRGSLASTVAHELNHTIYYYNHFDEFNGYTLLDEMIIEGLAENFKESVVDSKSSPWATAATRKEALELIAAMDDVLFSKDPDLIRRVLFGDKQYRQWMGYSAGYWLIKEYIKKNKALTWECLMNTDSKTIYSCIKEGVVKTGSTTP